MNENQHDTRKYLWSVDESGMNIVVIPNPDYSPQEPITISPTPGYIPEEVIEIVPDPGYRAEDSIFISPSPSYRPPTLHAIAYGNGLVENIRAQWCPVCHSGEDDIEELMEDGRPVWHCRECGHRW